jgi:hypothetical protein
MANGKRIAVMLHAYNAATGDSYRGGKIRTPMIRRGGEGRQRKSSVGEVCDLCALEP